MLSVCRPHIVREIDAFMVKLDVYDVTSLRPAIAECVIAVNWCALVGEGGFSGLQRSRKCSRCDARRTGWLELLQSDR